MTRKRRNGGNRTAQPFGFSHFVVLVRRGGICSKVDTPSSPPARGENSDTTLALEILMLRRVNAALFEAPAGARIEVVAQSQNNDGVNDARFEYAGTILPRENINGLPGCSFKVEGVTEQLQAVVAFADTASDSARYDLAEVENGVKTNLGKFTLKSDGSPLISFAIEPIMIAARVPMRSATRAAVRKKAPKRVSKKAARRKTRKPSTPRRGASRKRR
jgi:hypothetical protein